MTFKALCRRCKFQFVATAESYQVGRGLLRLLFTQREGRCWGIQKCGFSHAKMLGGEDVKITAVDCELPQLTAGGPTNVAYFFVTSYAELI